MRDTIGLFKKKSEVRIQNNCNTKSCNFNCKFKIADSRFKIPDSRFKITDYRLQIQSSNLSIFQSSNLSIFKSSILIKIYDISGKLVGIYKGEKIGEDLSCGVYFIRAVEQKSGSIHRIVKMK